jgi:hypothetical protein
MDSTQGGVLSTLATALIAYAVANININFVYAMIAGALGLAIFITREVLKAKGINIGSAFKK